MKKVEFKDVKEYAAAKHFKVSTLRLQGKEVSDITKFAVGLSHFLPGGGAEYDEASPAEKVYFVIEGEVTIYDKNKNKIVLRKYDSLYIGPNEGRSILNETNYPATMLVCMNYV